MRATSVARPTPSRVSLHIGELALIGVPPRDRAIFAEVFRSELARQLTLGVREQPRAETELKCPPLRARSTRQLAVESAENIGRRLRE